MNETMPPQESIREESLRRPMRALMLDAGTETGRPVRELLGRVFNEVWEADGFESAWDTVRRHVLDAIVVGQDCPREQCEQFISEVRRFDDAIEVISIVDGAERGRDALRAGAYDYFVLPVDLERLRTVLGHIEQTAHLRDRGGGITSQLDGTARIGSLCARYPAMLRALATVHRLGRYGMPVLVAGEMGTEKEEVARTLHFLGREGRPFVAREAASLSPTDLARACEEADGGTLFVDDVPALSAETAAALAAMVAPTALTADGPGVRIVVGCREDAGSHAEPATVREDLYARLAGAVIALPPLRERRDDIPVIARCLLRELADSDPSANDLSDEVAEALRDLRWPGNVTELRSVLAAAVGSAAGGRIELCHLPPLLRERAAGAGDPGSTRRLRDLEVQHLRQVLSETSGNKSRAARILGVSRWALQRRIRKHGLELEFPQQTGDGEDSDDSESQVSS